MTGYATSVYDRANRIVTQAADLQATRFSDDAIRLLNMVRSNYQQISDSTSAPGNMLAQSFFQVSTQLRLFRNSASFLYSDFIEVNQQMDLYASARIVYCEARRWRPFRTIPAATASPCQRSLRSNENLPFVINVPTDKAESRPDYIVSIRNYMEEVNNLLFQVNAGAPPGARADGLFPYELSVLRASIENFRSWFLPALYGALGSAIFFVRRFLNPRLPNPELIRVLYRILVGAFAGVIFAWFWLVFQGAPAQPQTASPTPFALAFVIGYATDLLFQALDKTVETISTRIGRPAT